MRKPNSVVSDITQLSYKLIIDKEVKLLLRTVMTIAIIVVLLLGGSYTSYRFIEKNTTIIDNHLITVEQLISNKNWELAKNELTTTQQNWQKGNLWWSILIDHQEIETIDLSIKRLEKFIETENLSYSIVEVSTLRLHFMSIYESEKPSLKNIL